MRFAKIPFEKSEAETRDWGAVLSPSCAQRKCNFFVAQRGSASRGRRSPFLQKAFRYPRVVCGFLVPSSGGGPLFASCQRGHRLFLLHCHAPSNTLRLSWMPRARPQRRALLRKTCQGRRQARCGTRGQGEGRTRCTPPPGARDDRATRLRRAMADAAPTLHSSASLLSGMPQAGEACGSDGRGSHRPSPGMREASLR